MIFGITGGGLISPHHRVYKFLASHSEIDPAFSWICKSYCQPKHKVFFWLLIKDILCTRNLLKRRNMKLESYNCELCSLAVEESSDHLFPDCPFARQCWGIIGLDIPDNSSFPSVVSILKDQLNSEFFMVAVILLIWTISTARNKLIFEGLQWSSQDCRIFLNKELLMVSHRAHSLNLLFEQWTATLLW